MQYRSVDLKVWAFKFTISSFAYILETGIIILYFNTQSISSTTWASLTPN